MIPFAATDRGLVKMLVVILIALLVLAYFGLNLRSIVGSNTFQDNWAFIRDGAVSIWDSYLKAPAEYLWNKIFIPLIWEPALNNLTRMKDTGGGVITPGQTPTLPSAQTVQ